MYKFELTSHSIEDLRIQINSYAVELNALVEQEVQLELKPEPIDIDIPNFAPSTPSIPNFANVDLKGQIFDENLHSSSRKFNQDGSWKARRGTVSTSTPVVATPVVATPVVATPVVATPVVAANNLVHNLETFRANLPMVFAQLITEGKIKQDYIAQLCTHFKVDQIWKIQSDESACAQVFSLFTSHKFITKVE